MMFDGTDSPAMPPHPGDYSTAESTIAIEGGRVVTPSGTIEAGTVLLQGDRIDRVRPEMAPLADQTIDASNRIVMPGIIDAHGDDFEQQLIPRTGATIAPQTAFSASDRFNVSHGITTKIHAIACENEEAGHRSPAGAHTLISELAQTKSLIGTNLVHARFEVSSTDPAVAREVMADDLVVLASLMNHTPGAGQYEEPGTFENHYESQVGLTEDAVETISRSRERNNAGWEDVAPAIISDAKELGIPIASHDDRTLHAVKRAARHGISISEFPLTEEVAKAASSLNMSTIMGAPNLVRGESLFDNLTTARAIELGVLDVLCADYHPPSLLQAAFVETGEPLHTRVARITQTPARILGLADRGRITPGARADILVVDPDPVPRPTDVIIGGRVVLRQPTTKTHSSLIPRE